jgi:hypothetical protein
MSAGVWDSVRLQINIPEYFGLWKPHYPAPSLRGMTSWWMQKWILFSGAYYRVKYDCFEDFISRDIFEMVVSNSRGSATRDICGWEERGAKCDPPREAFRPETSRTREASNSAVGRSRIPTPLTLCQRDLRGWSSILMPVANAAYLLHLWSDEHVEQQLRASKMMLKELRELAFLLIF